VVLKNTLQTPQLMREFHMQMGVFGIMEERDHFNNL
jgi:hypothetical protein